MNNYVLLKHKEYIGELYRPKRKILLNLFCVEFFRIVGKYKELNFKKMSPSIFSIYLGGNWKVLTY